jgi:transposase-like protein
MMEETKVNKRIHSADEKLKVVLKILKQKETVNEIVKTHKINISLARKWKNEAIKSILQRFSKGDKKIKDLKKDHLYEITKLKKEIETLEKNLNWIKKKATEFNIQS